MRGFKQVLLIEDDMAFHKDLGFIKSVIEETPDNADFANYDPRFGKAHYYDKNGKEVDVKKPVDSTFLRYDGTVWNMSCL